ncbi:hypothetical protein EH165_05880 [Nakamurella antarctica]|uniref:Uncharacterized protein n=1 Tax=Nakamurella antarctica TaxID=1902245 RepID=A0A3G8ZLU3_9ACTN|nr:hypothetical protein [Nakamurella antarctica]AZI57747.1 hypothetical protein EH165_05880 [Nakamurella antarctica]
MNKILRGAILAVLLTSCSADPAQVLGDVETLPAQSSAVEPELPATETTSISAATTDASTTSVVLTLPAGPELSATEPSETTSIAIESVTPSTTSVDPVPGSAAIDPSLSLSAEELADRTEIERVWREFWVLYARINRVEPLDRAALLGMLVMDPALTAILAEATDFDARGLDSYGTVELHPYWEYPVAGFATAQISDCRDASQFGSLYASSGEKRSVGVAASNTVGAFARLDGVWRLYEISYRPDLPCQVS